MLRSCDRNSHDAQQKQKGKGRAVLTIPEVEKKDIICFALYTVHDGTLKLTAQLYPLAEDDPKAVRLEIEKGGEWVEVAKVDAIDPGWTALSRRKLGRQQGGQIPRAPW